MINGQRMKRTEEYKYLGEYINEKGTEAMTVEERIKEVHGTMNEILALVNSSELKYRRVEIRI